MIHTVGAQYFEWNVENEFIDARAFEGVSTLINLTGANITVKRWTEARKIALIESRIRAIDLLFKNVKTKAVPIDTFISTSATGYYGAITSDEIFSEDTPKGDDFLASVCRDWEAATRQFEDLGVTTVVLTHIEQIVH